MWCPFLLQRYFKQTYGREFMIILTKYNSSHLSIHDLVVISSISWPLSMNLWIDWCRECAKTFPIAATYSQHVGLWHMWLMWCPFLLQKWFKQTYDEVTLITYMYLSIILWSYPQYHGHYPWSCGYYPWFQWQQPWNHGHLNDQNRKIINNSETI